MQKHVVFILITVFLIFSSGVPITHGAPVSETNDGNTTYNLRIELSQWDTEVIDLLQVEELLEDDSNLTTSEAYDQAMYTGEIGPFELGATINFSIVSRDVQHGFSIDELGIAVAANRPAAGVEFGDPIIVEAELPDEDVTLEGYCHIFCGLGHDDDTHKVDFVVGKGNDIELLEIQASHHSM